MAAARARLPRVETAEPARVAEVGTAYGVSLGGCVQASVDPARRLLRARTRSRRMTLANGPVPVAR